MSFIVCVLTRIQIATPKWIVPNTIAALRKTLGSKNMEQIKNWEISLSLHNYWLRLHVFTFSQLWDMHIYYRQELKSIYTCQDVRIENTTTLNVKYILTTYNNVYGCTFTNALCSAFLSWCCVAGEKTIFRWHRLVLVTSSNHSGPSQIFRALPLPALPLPPIIRADFLYLYIRGEVECRSSERNK